MERNRHAYLQERDGIEVACEGHLDATVSLLDAVLSSTGTLDALVFPIVAAWRTHVELRLRLIHFLATAASDPDGSVIPESYPMAQLWLHVRKYVAEHSAIDPVHLDDLDLHVAELARADRASYVFRYSSAGQGFPSLPKNLAIGSTHEFREAVLEVAEALRKVCRALSALIRAPRTQTDTLARLPQW